MPTLWKTNAVKTGWEEVAGATVSGSVVQAQITGFSWVVIRTPLSPYRKGARSGESSYVGKGCVAVHGRLRASDEGSSYSYYSGC